MTAGNMRISEKDPMIRISSSKISASDTPGHAGQAGIHAIHNESAAAADVVDGVLQEFDGAGGLDHDVEPVRAVLLESNTKGNVNKTSELEQSQEVF